MSTIIHKSLDKATTNSTGTPLVLTEPTDEFMLQYHAAGTPSGTIHLEGSLDGEHFYPLGHGSIAAGVFTVESAGLLASQARARLEGMTHSVTVTAYVVTKDKTAHLGASPKAPVPDPSTHGKTQRG